MELFVKIVNGCNIFAKNFVLDVWQGSEYSPQPVFTRSKLTIEASEQGVKYVQS